MSLLMGLTQSGFPHLLILAPLKTSRQIMEDINREFGINSKANGIITAVPTEKAYKI